MLLCCRERRSSSAVSNRPAPRHADDLIQCGHCGNAITGEVKTKKIKKGSKDYRYYRCARYNKPGYPRIRLKEADLDEQVLAMFERVRIENDDVREWFARVLHARTRHDQKAKQDRLAELSRQVVMVRNQEDQLLNLRLMDEIEEQPFARKGRELRDRLAQLNLQVDAATTAEPNTPRLRSKRLNFSLEGVTLVPTMRKPFDVLAEGLVSENSRGNWTPIELFRRETAAWKPDFVQIVAARAAR